jgi:cytochrome c2
MDYRLSSAQRGAIDGLFRSGKSKPLALAIEKVEFLAPRSLQHLIEFPLSVYSGVSQIMRKSLLQPEVLTALMVAFLIGCKAKIDQEKFDPLNRAGRAIQGALQSGVSYPRFTELLQAFSTEVLVAQDKVNSDVETELVKSYSDAFSIYSDSAELWRAFNSYSLEGCYSGHVALNSMTESIIDKYGIYASTCEGDYGRPKRSVSKDAFKDIWRRAEAPMEAAGRLYRGESTERVPKSNAEIAKQGASVAPSRQPASETPATPEARGKMLINDSGNLCSVCHSVDGSESVGPSLKGIWGQKVKLTDGSEVTVDDAYIRESIYKPAAKIVRGYGPVMPAMYDGKISEQEVSDIISYLKSLK